MELEKRAGADREKPLGHAADFELSFKSREFVNRRVTDSSIY